MQNLDQEGKAAVENCGAYVRGPSSIADVHYEVEGHRKLLDYQEVYLKSLEILTRPILRNSRGA